MNDSVWQLYPLPAVARELEGLYLAHNLREHAVRANAPYVYANFVTSLDGRIAIPGADGGRLMIPKNTANARDWRLYQELVAQADLVISTGRYLREWAEGRAQEILQLDDPRFADLRAWREQHGLPPYPDFAIISSSLDFSIPEILTKGGRRAMFFTTANPNPERVREIEANAGHVIVAGENSVEGGPLVQRMNELGYRTIYSAAGPKILHMLLEGNVLNRLYLTLAHRILGGVPFASLVEGPLLEPAVGFTLNALYLDALGLDGLGQVFAAYDVAHGHQQRD